MAAMAVPVASQSIAGIELRLQSLRAALDAGRYNEAEGEARVLASALESEHDSQLERRKASTLLVEALTRNGHGAQSGTRALAEALVGQYEQAPREDGGDLATSVRDLGDVLLEAGEYKLATTSFERAVRLREGHVGVSHPDVAEDLDHLARALTWVERYDEALGRINRALAIKELALAPKDVALARTLYVRGLLWQRKGEYARARADLERALAVRQSVQAVHPETAALLTLLGEQAWFEGDLLQARDVLTRAADLAEATLRPGHPDIASSLRSLAIPIHDLGDLAGARSLRERALKIAEEAYRDHPLVAVQLNDLALSLIQQGDYAGARRLQQRALRMYERHLGRDHSYVTTTVFNLALLHLSIGDVLEASRLQQRAIRTWERVVGPDHPYVAFALLGYAESLADRGEHRQAVEFFERALVIRTRALGASHPRVARILTHLARSLRRLGDVGRAAALAERSLGIWEKSGDRDGLAESLLVYAAIQSDRGDYLAAKRAYDRALEIRLPLFGTTHPSIAEARAGLATALAGLRRPEEALQTSLDAEEIGRNHLRLTLGYLPERQALGYAARRPKGLDLALSLLSQAPARVRVLDAVIRGRALTLDAIALRRHTLGSPAATEIAPLWAALSSARQRYANLAVKGPSETRPEQYSSQLEDARRDKEEAERALAERSTAFGAQLARGEVGLDEVRAGLPASSALVSFVRYDRYVFDEQTGSARIVPSYIAFVLRPGDVEPVVVPLGRAAAIDALIAGWRRAVLSDVLAVPVSSRPAGDSARLLGRNLRQRIWDPVSIHLSGAARAFIVPDGTLNLVPFAALPVERARYLLEAGPTLHYLSAERDLVGHDEAVETRGEGLLVVGNPAFSDRPSSASRVTQSTLDAARLQEQPVSFRGSGSSCPSFHALRFAPLPASRLEVQDVAALWRTSSTSGGPGPTVQMLTGRAAQEGAFKYLGPGRRVLHLATHGFFLGGDCASALDRSRGVGGLSASRRPASPRAAPENPLLLSGLVLAGANRRAAAGPDEDDGILTSEEVSALHLEGVEWAVLSACDTGLGELRAGEGVFGLRRAFQSAGVRTVIMSLWSVEDQATRVWMRALYTARLQRKLDTADAVRQASLTVLRDRRARGQSTHPFYWASFVAAGDWR